MESFSISNNKSYIKITRKKKFAGRLIPYIIIVNYDLEDFKKYIAQAGYALNENAMKNLSFNPLSPYINMPRSFNIENFKSHLAMLNLSKTVKTFEISNGETKILEIDNIKTPIFVASFTSSGVVFSNQVYCDGTSINSSYLVETKYSWKTGSTVSIHEE